MSGFNSSDYYRRRAEQAAVLAEAATMPTVKAIHRDMATRYTAMAEASADGFGRPMLKLAF